MDIIGILAIYGEFNLGTPQLLHVIGTVFLVFSVVIMCYELLKKKWNNLKTKYAYIALHFFLIVFLLPAVAHSNINSVAFTLSLIIIIFAIRYILYNIYLWYLGKPKGESVKNKWLASFASYILIYVVFSSLILPIGILSFKILIMFCVYAIYDLMKIKYLPSTYTKNHMSENSTKIFNSFNEIDSFVWIIVLLLFMLYNYNIFNVEKQTLYYFYSTISQIFSALLGIVVMFGILILQEERKTGEKSIKIIFLKNGLIGFSLLYVFVIILSITGILVVNNVFQENVVEALSTYSPIAIQYFINMTLFETIFLMTPVALFYLYALVKEFLKLDEIEDSEYQKSMSDY